MIWCTTENFARVWQVEMLEKRARVNFSTTEKDNKTDSHYYVERVFDDIEEKVLKPCLCHWMPNLLGFHFRTPFVSDTFPLINFVFIIT